MAIRPTGIPGIPGIGKTTAAKLVTQYGAIESFPETVLDENARKLALLFKDLATLRTNAPLFANVDQLRWQGPPPTFDAFVSRIGDEKLLPRARKAAAAPE